MLRLLLALAGVFAVTAPAAAQEMVERQSVPAQLTLEEAINIALGNSGAYLRLLNDSAVNEASRRNAFSRLLPVPSGNVSTGAGPSRSTNPFGTTSSSASNTSLSFGLSLNIWDGGQTLNSYRQSKMQITSSRLGLMAQETSLRASVMNQYYQTQQAERAVALEKQLLAVRQQELTDNEARFRAALIGVLDRERAFQTVRQYENNVRNTEDNLERSRLALLGTLGISAPTNFTLVTPLPPPGDTAGLNADSLVSIAMVRNPGLQQQEISLEQTRMNARLTRNSRFMPRVGLSASFGRGISQQGYSAFLDPGSRSTSLSSNIGISFSFSQLLDIPGTSLRLRQTAASEEDAALNLRDQRLNLERQVRTAVLDLRAAYRALDFAQQAVVNARLQVEVANAQLGAGTIPYFNYQSIVDGASQTERDVLNQQFNVLSRRIALDQLLGNRPGN